MSGSMQFQPGISTRPLGGDPAGQGRLPNQRLWDAAVQQAGAIAPALDPAQKNDLVTALLKAVAEVKNPELREALLRVVEALGGPGAAQGGAPPSGAADGAPASSQAPAGCSSAPPAQADKPEDAAVQQAGAAAPGMDPAERNDLVAALLKAAGEVKDPKQREALLRIVEAMGGPAPGAAAQGAGQQRDAAGGPAPAQPGGPPAEAGTPPGTTPPPEGAVREFSVESVGRSAPISSHEVAELAKNKKAAMAALDAAGATPQEKAIILAVGMQETGSMHAGQRDANKDGTSSENVSAFNMSSGMAKDLGWKGDSRALNDQANVGEAAKLLLNGLRTKGVDATLNLERGGSTAERDGVSYGAADYRAGIKTVAELILKDPALLTNATRIAPNTPGV